MNKYRLVSKKGEGTFSEVLKASSIVSGQVFAIKCMKSQFKSLDQVNSLREIQALKRLNPHPNIVHLEEILFDSHSGRLALVFECLEMNLYEFIKNKKQPLRSDLVQHLMWQMMKATAHMHQNGIFHRDLKPENILLSFPPSAPFPLLKIADFGSCRGIHSPAPHTEYISTRWYRSPECILTNGMYDYKMDCWGIGAVMFEIIALFPLFPGTNELDQIERIHSILGTPTPEVLAQFKSPSSHMKNINFHPRQGSGIGRLIPHASPEAVDLITKLIAYEPEKRITAKQALKHPYFKECRERERKEKAQQMNSGSSASGGGQAAAVAQQPSSGSSTVPSLSQSQTQSQSHPHSHAYPSHSYSSQPSGSSSVDSSKLPSINSSVLSGEIESPNSHRRKKEKEKEKERERERDRERDRDSDKEKDSRSLKGRDRDRSKRSSNLAHSASKSSIKPRQPLALQLFPSLKQTQTHITQSNANLPAPFHSHSHASSVSSSIALSPRSNAENLALSSPYTHANSIAHSRFPALDSLSAAASMGSGQKSKVRKEVRTNLPLSVGGAVGSSALTLPPALIDSAAAPLFGSQTHRDRGSDRKSKKLQAISGSITARK